MVVLARASNYHRLKLKGSSNSGAFSFMYFLVTRCDTFINATT